MRSIASVSIVGWTLSLILWANPLQAQRATLKQHRGHIDGIVFTPNGEHVVAAGWDTITIWDSRNGNEVRTLSGGKLERYLGLAVNGEGTLLAVGGQHAAQVWETGSGRLASSLARHPSRTYCVAFSPDGKSLASGGTDKVVCVWDVATGKPKLELGHKYTVQSVAFSPDGKMLATGGRDLTVHLWDLSSGKETHTSKRHTDVVLSLAFSPDGSSLASGSEDKTVKIWNVATGSERATIPAHDGWVNSVAYSPDGRLLATAGMSDRTAKLWDAESLKQLAVIRGHTKALAVVAFSPDGKTLATGGWDDVVRLWDVPGLLDKANSP
jgi:WD40 repeat protein